MANKATGKIMQRLHYGGGRHEGARFRSLLLSFRTLPLMAFSAAAYSPALGCGRQRRRLWTAFVPLSGAVEPSAAFLGDHLAALSLRFYVCRLSGVCVCVCVCVCVRACVCVREVCVCVCVWRTRAVFFNAALRQWEKRGRKKAPFFAVSQI